MFLFERKKKNKGEGRKEQAAEDRWTGFDGYTTGTIRKVERPMVGVQVLTVEYEVDGEEYLIQEVVQAKNPPKRISVYPPLEKTIPKMGSIEPGTLVEVCYKTAEPDHAYLPTNQE